MKEVYGDDELSRSEYNDEWASKHDFDQDGAKNWNEVYDILKTGKFRRDSTEGLNYNDLFPNPKVQNVIKHLEKSGVINGNYFSKPISHQTFLNLVKYTIKKDKNLINPSRLKDYVNLDRIAKYYDGDYYKIVNPSSLSKEEEDLNKRLRFYPITHAHMIIKSEEYVKDPKEFDGTLSYAGNSSVKLSADGSILPVQAEEDSNGVKVDFRGDTLIKVGKYPVYRFDQREKASIGKAGLKRPNTHMNESKNIKLSSIKLKSRMREVIKQSIICEKNKNKKYMKL